MTDLDRISIGQIKQGYYFAEKTGQFHCLYCQATFEDGLVYQSADQYCTAARAIINHIREAHDSPFEQLLAMDKRFIGLTENQKKLLRLIREGKSNQDIASMTGNATSTIRAQRFLFKEKGRQAKLLLALLELLEEETGAATAVLAEDPDLVSPIHATAIQIDERFAITAAEKAKVIKTYVESSDPLIIRALPVKEKRKLILLGLIATQFMADRQYTEKEINDILHPIYSDHVTIRRYLIEYGYLDRTVSGSAYWVKNGAADPAATDKKGC